MLLVWRKLDEGTLRSGELVALCHSSEEEPPLRRRLTQLMGFVGLGRVDVDQRSAGDLFVVAGFVLPSHRSSTDNEQ